MDRALVMLSFILAHSAFTVYIMAKITTAIQEHMKRDLPLGAASDIMRMAAIIVLLKISSVVIVIASVVMHFI